MAYHRSIKGTLALLLAGAVSVSAVEQSSWGRVKQAVEEEQGAAAKAAPAKGTVKPFELVVEALQDVNQVTDVTVTTKVILPGFSAPGLAKHIQLKSFDTAGELRWTKNEQNVGLSASGASSTARFQYRDMLRRQPVQVREQIQNAQTGNTEVLEAKGGVQLRPDVAVQEVTVPPQVRVGQLFNIPVNVAELNGDLGATTNVVLRQGGQTLDHANGVVVGALGAVGVVFTAKFDQAGTYDLTVVAQDVVPGDYDGRNNSKTVSVVVTAGVQAVPFWLDYYSYDHRNNYSYSYWGYWWDYSYGNGGFQYYDYADRYQYLQEQLYLPGNSISFPVDRVSFEIATDNVPRLAVEMNNIPSYYDYNDGCYSNAAGSVSTAEGVYVYLQHYSDCNSGYAYSYAYAQQYAQQYNYFSYYYYYYWGPDYSYFYGPYTSFYNYSYGTFIPATNRVDTRFIVEDGGQSYGGNASIESIFNYNYDYNWSDYYGWQNYHYSQSYGSSSGVTQP